MFDSLFIAAIVSVLITIPAMVGLDDYANYSAYKEMGHINKNCSYLKYIWIRLKRL